MDAEQLTWIRVFLKSIPADAGERFVVACKYVERLPLISTRYLAVFISAWGRKLTEYPIEDNLETYG